MEKSALIAVASGSFSRNHELRASLEQLGIPVRYHSEDQVLRERELVKFLEGATHAIIGKEPIDEPCLRELPFLRVISKYGVGVNNLDLEAIRNAGIRLQLSPGVNKRAVAELCLSLMLGLLRQSQLASFRLRNSHWQRVIGQQLTGRRIGIVGCGHIGKDLVRLLQPFHCEIRVNDPIEYRDFYKQYAIKSCTLTELLQHSEIVTLHLPLSDETYHLISERELKQMRRGSFLINTARGGLVCERSLLKALNQHHLAGAASDVFEHEPETKSGLLQLDQFIGTPHIGGSSSEAVRAMGMAAIAGLGLDPGENQNKTKAPRKKPSRREGDLIMDVIS